MHTLIAVTVCVFPLLLESSFPQTLMKSNGKWRDSRAPSQKFWQEEKWMGKFPFYVYNELGELETQWMTMADIQEILLIHPHKGSKESSKPLKIYPPNLLGAPQFANKRRPEQNVLQVVAKIQKVMNEEVAKGTTPPPLEAFLTTNAYQFWNNSGNGLQIITIPDTILAYLMKDTVSSLETMEPVRLITARPTTSLPGGETLQSFDVKRHPSLDNDLQSNSANDERNAEIEITENYNSFPSEATWDIETPDKFNTNSDYVDSNYLNAFESNGLTYYNNERLPENISATSEENYLLFNDLNGMFNAIASTITGNVGITDDNKITTKHEYSDTATPPTVFYISKDYPQSESKPYYTMTTLNELDQTTYYLPEESESEATQSFNKELNNVNTGNIVEVSANIATTEHPKVGTTMPYSETVKETTTHREKVQESSFFWDFPTTHRSTHYWQSTQNKELLTTTSTMNPTILDYEETKVIGDIKDDIVATNVLVTHTSNESDIYSSRLDFEALEKLPPADNYEDYFDVPVYLDNVPEDYFNPDTSNAPANDLMFPDRNESIPYIHNPSSPPQSSDDHYLDEELKQIQSLASASSSSLQEAPFGNPGLEATVENLDPKLKEFFESMNEVSFSIYKKVAATQRRQNYVMSSLSLISALMMMVLGARGPSLEILHNLVPVDHYMTFNPHEILKNVTDSIKDLRDEGNLIAFLNQMFIEKPPNKSYMLDFFAKTLGYFYDAHVEQRPWSSVGSRVRDLVNLGIFDQTRWQVNGFLKENAYLQLSPPLSLVSSAVFKGKWILPVTEEDLFEMNFIRFPTAERRLVRSIGIRKKMTVNAGYSSKFGATAAEIPLYSELGDLSLIAVLPGKPKDFVANGLAQMEKKMNTEMWSGIMKSMSPHNLQLEVPFFQHKSFQDLSTTLKGIGLQDIFMEDTADFSGITGMKKLYLGGIVQLTEFHSALVENINPSTFRLFSLRNKKDPTGSQIDSKRGFYSRKKRQAYSDRKNSDFGDIFFHPNYTYGLPISHNLKWDNITVKNIKPVNNREINYIRLRPLTSIAKSSPPKPQKNKHYRDFYTLYLRRNRVPFSSKKEEQTRDNLNRLHLSVSRMGEFPQIESAPGLNHLHLSVSRMGELPQIESAPALNRSYLSVGRMGELPQIEAKLDMNPSDLSVNRMGELPQIESAPALNPSDLSVNHMGELPQIEPKLDINRSDLSVNRMGELPQIESVVEGRQQTQVLSFDRAFFYAIRHNPTGLIIFIGRYLDPEP